MEKWGEGAVRSLSDPDLVVLSHWKQSQKPLEVGERFTIEGVYERIRWWEFWRWFSERKLREFTITDRYP